MRSLTQFRDIILSYADAKSSIVFSRKMFGSISKKNEKFTPTAAKKVIHVKPFHRNLGADINYEKRNVCFTCIINKCLQYSSSHFLGNCADPKYLARLLLALHKIDASS